MGGFIGCLVFWLDLLTVVSYRGPDAALVIVGGALGLLLWPTRFKKALQGLALAIALVWLAVAYTPLTHWMVQPLLRADRLSKADAIFVLGSGLQPDGELTAIAMSRLLHGLQLLARGYAPRLVLTELPDHPSYRDAACQLMDDFALEQEVISIGPIVNTRDEAVAVGELSRDWGWESLLIVTSPSHTRRAAGALEREGVRVIVSPSVQTGYDLASLDSFDAADTHLESFGYIIHEYAGLIYYRLKGWL